MDFKLKVLPPDNVRLSQKNIVEYKPGVDVSDDLPLPNGIASAGISEKASRSDHVHPADSRLDDIVKIEANPEEEDTEVLEKIKIEDTVYSTPKSEKIYSDEKTGQFLHGNNTLKDAVNTFKIESKNLIVFPYAASSQEKNGISFTINSDGTILLNGTATSATYIVIAANNSQIIKKSGYYTLSGGENLSPSIRFIVYKNGKVWMTANSNNGSTGFFEDNDVFSGLTLDVDSGTTIDNLTIYPQIEYGKNVSPYSQYLPDGTPVNLTVSGDNFIDISKLKEETRSGVTVTVDGDIVTLNGTLSQTENLGYTDIQVSMPETAHLSAYYVSGNLFTEGSAVLYLDDNLNDSSINNYADVRLPSAEQGVNTKKIKRRGSIVKAMRIYCTRGTVFNNYKFRIKLSVEDTDYSPYKEKTYTSAIGETIELAQYDNITNVFSNTDGVSIDGKFILSAQYELNDKITPIFGTFANRPTTTQNYAVMYIATDQTGDNKITILPPNTDGSVSSNWISI